MTRDYKYIKATRTTEKDTRVPWMFHRETPSAHAYPFLKLSRPLKEMPCTFSEDAMRLMNLGLHSSFFSGWREGKRAVVSSEGGNLEHFCRLVVSQLSDLGWFGGAPGDVPSLGTLSRVEGSSHFFFSNKKTNGKRSVQCSCHYECEGVMLPCHMPYFWV